MKDDDLITLPSGKTLTLVIANAALFEARTLMDLAEKEAWCLALESGKYEQGTQRLRDHEDDRYCCLGVKCALDGLDFDEYTGYQMPDGDYMDEALSTNYAPGLWDSGEFGNFQLIDRGQGQCFTSLAEINDFDPPGGDWCYDFRDIAHIIRLLF